MSLILIITILNVLPCNRPNHPFYKFDLFRPYTHIYKYLVVTSAFDHLVVVVVNLYYISLSALYSLSLLLMIMEFFMVYL